MFGNYYGKVIMNHHNHVPCEIRALLEEKIDRFNDVPGLKDSGKLTDYVLAFHPRKGTRTMLLHNAGLSPGFNSKVEICFKN